MKVRIISKDQAKVWLPRRKKDAHKGDSGRVYILAGSKGMVGAGVLCAFGATRCGAGLVRLATVESQQVVAAKRVPLEVTTQALPEDSYGHLDQSAWIQISKTLREFQPHVVAAGPGLGQSAAVHGILKRLLDQLDFPVVLDADGLNVFSKATRALIRKAPLIITPHAGELARLLNRSRSFVNSHRIESAVKAARNFGCVCLLKGPGTLVTDGKQVWKNITGNPGMASGGMGDVLTGMIAAFWGHSQRNFLDGFRAACLGAYVHGLAGDLCVKRVPQLSVTASDLIRFIPTAIKILK